MLVLLLLLLYELTHPLVLGNIFHRADLLQLDTCFLTNKSGKSRATTRKLKQLDTRIIEMTYKIEAHRRHLSALPKGFRLFQLGKEMFFIKKQLWLLVALPLGRLYRIHFVPSDWHRAHHSAADNDLARSNLSSRIPAGG